jgi:ATP-binding cassette subfamily B protein
VKLFGDERRELNAFTTQANAVRDAGVSSAMLGRVFFVALGLVGAVGTAAIYGIGAWLVVDGDITAGTLVALAALVTRVYQPLTGLTNARVDLMTSMVSFERVFEVLDAPEPIVDKPGAIDLVDCRGAISLDDVVFRYPAADATAVRSMEQQAVPGADPDRDVLAGVSLDVSPGETVAVVGASGAGKSTLVSLIPRLYDVTAGAVRVDSHDVRDLTLTSLRSAIGVVAQDPHLFHVSIAENLRFARPDASTDDLERVCRAARIHNTIAALPDGYDTVVGERGYRLSGGEKQRLAIARLLLKNPAIMILDEATSHLDMENESLVQAALEEALAGRTAIVIAHRLSTVRSADRIVVLHDGRIAETGTHDELVAANGLYASQLRAGELLDVDAV